MTRHVWRALRRGYLRSFGNASLDNKWGDGGGADSGWRQSVSKSVNAGWAAAESVNSGRADTCAPCSHTLWHCLALRNAAHPHLCPHLRPHLCRNCPQSELAVVEDFLQVGSPTPA
eukprot:364371-Chlamydomonas_euryale.AAC.3